MGRIFLGKLVHRSKISCVVDMYCKRMKMCFPLQIVRFNILDFFQHEADIKYSL